MHCPNSENAESFSGTHNSRLRVVSFLDTNKTQGNNQGRLKR